MTGPRKRTLPATPVAALDLDEAASGYPRALVVIEPVAVTRAVAAQMLGISLRHFEVEVQPHLALVYCGRKRLVPVRELKRWVGANAVRTDGTR